MTSKQRDMSTPKSDRVLGPLHDFAEFARRIGANDQALILQKLHDRLKTEKLSAKQVEEASWDAVAKAYFWILRHIVHNQPDLRPFAYFAVNFRSLSWFPL